MKEETQVREHDCRKNLVWTNQGREAEYTKCMYCGRIVDFRWKSLLKNIRNIFQLTK